MPDPAATIFSNLSSYSGIKTLIDNGEAESLYLECKAPHSPSVDRGIRASLSQALSGFSNSSGGVIIWGVDTTNHPKSGLDILTQIIPIGNVSAFAKRIDSAIPTLTAPPVQTPPSKVLVGKPGDTRGIVITFIPKTSGDPVQALESDYVYWMRSTDEFVKLPHEFIKRLFASTQGPELVPDFHAGLVKSDANGFWDVPFILENRSSAAGLFAMIRVAVKNSSACETIVPVNMVDQSSVNPGVSVYSQSSEKPVFRGLNQIMGHLKFKMKRSGKISKRVLDLEIEVFAQQMRAKRWIKKVSLAKKGFSVRNVSENWLY